MAGSAGNLVKQLEGAKRDSRVHFETLQSKINLYVDRSIYPLRKEMQPKHAKAEFGEMKELMGNVNKALERVEELERRIPNSLQDEYKYEKERARYLLATYEEAFGREYSQTPELKVDIQKNPNQSDSTDPDALNAGIKEMRRLLERAKDILTGYKAEEDEMERNPATKQFKKEMHEKAHWREKELAKKQIEMYEKGLDDSYKQAEKLKIKIDKPREDDWVRPDTLKTEIIGLRGSVVRVKEKLNQLLAKEQVIKRGAPNPGRHEMLEKFKYVIGLSRETVKDFEIGLAYKQAALLKIELYSEKQKIEESSEPSSSSAAASIR